MHQKGNIRFTHTDIELMRLRLSLSSGQRIQAMLDARALVVGSIRGRLRKRHPNMSEADLNMKMLEEVERAQSVKSWPQFVLKTLQELTSNNSFQNDSN
ncbi:MAG: hypothetical protein DWQ04_29280 [Chloroflexi bacterium]|nr:MAG: hypothetical protein DWQ04_29280 [Chloroflexota bacterium]